MRIAFAGVSNFVYSNCDLDDIIINGVNTIRDRIEDLEKRIGNEEKVYFNPSRTAQNGINFITRELIEELKRCENEAIKDLFKLLYIMNNQDYNSPNLISEFFEMLSQKGIPFRK
jgi:site-specific DNA-adenine methylase